MAYTYPTIDDFKAYWVRAFPFSTDPTLGVTDADISNALNLAQINGGQCPWPNQNTFSIAQENLAAHYLSLSLSATSGGAGGTYSWIESSKSVQGVAQSFTIPQSIANNPYFAMLTSTRFGAMYFQMIYPYLTGVMFSVQGTTQGDGNGAFPGVQPNWLGGISIGGF